MFPRICRHTLWHRQLKKTWNYLNSMNLSLKRQSASDLIKTTLENRGELSSNNDWKQIREQILQHESNRGQFSLDNIDALILNYCLKNNTNLGFSYIDFMSKLQIKKNIATLGKYMQLIYLKNEKHLLEGTRCPDDEQNHIIECYDSLRKQYPILDCFTLDNAALALSVTSNWKKCVELMKEIEITSESSVRVHSAMIAAAFSNGEHDLAWELLEDMFLKEKVPLSIPFITYINIAKHHNTGDAKLMLEKLLLFFQENDFICKEDFISNLSSFLKDIDLQGIPVNVTQRGQCNNCQQRLEKYELSTEEFDDLKKAFFEKVIIGKDVFLKSNPEELEAFKEFLEGMDEFDVVLDGLNIAYKAGSSSKKILSNMVTKVVSHFVQQNKKVLVLGRKHMQSWPPYNWNYIKKNSAVFLTQDLSQDDPYLLYCTLNSGKDTILVTNDLMRSHKFRLKTQKHKLLFSRWLSQRQYQLVTITANGTPIFRHTPFNVTAQKNGNSWHIPYRLADNKDEFHKTWFCIKWK